MKDARIGLRAPTALVKEAKAIARRRKTTLTAILIQHLEEIVEAERKVRMITQVMDSEQV